MSLVMQYIYIVVVEGLLTEERIRFPWNPNAMRLRDSESPRKHFKLVYVS
jgi:hypothetical protein